MNLQQWSDNCCRATLKPFAIDRTTHRSKRNRRICCIWLWLWWVETLSSSFLIQSNLDERTWKRYVVYGIRFRIRFYKYPRSKGRAETTRFFLSFSLCIPAFTRIRVSRISIPFPRSYPSFPPSFFLYLSNSAIRLFHESRSPEGENSSGTRQNWPFKRDVRRNSRSIHDKISRGEEYKSVGPHDSLGPIITFRASN